MPSFSMKLKDELVDIALNDEEEKAMLMGLMQINGSINLSSSGLYLEFRSKNLKVAKKVEDSIKKFYSIEPLFKEEKELRLNKDNVYSVLIEQNATIPLLDLKIMAAKEDSTYNLKKELIKDNLRLSYIKGAFLACGSVNDPQTLTYHMEIQTFNTLTAYNLRDLLNVYNLQAKVSKNRRGYIVYLKSADKIADFIRILGSSESLFYFEDYRIERDLSNSINRVMNCEIANEKKATAAAIRQMKEIETVKAYYKERLPKSIREAIVLREKNQDSTLQELSDKSPDEFNKTISKSALNHRYRAVHKLYTEIIEKREKYNGSKLN